jgi:deoxyadenosine/deoxycytidine kinase
VFLDVPLDELMRRIHERGRPYEMGMPEQYLKRLRDQYELTMDKLGQRVHRLEVTPGESRQSVVARVAEVARQELADEQGSASAS